MLARRGLAALGAIAVLGGCDTGYSYDQTAELAAMAAPSRVVSKFSDLTFEALSAPSFTAFQLDSRLPVIVTPSFGRSFVKGFALPEDNNDLRVTVHAYLVTGSTIVYPVVTLLDGAKQPFDATREDSFLIGSNNEVMPSSVARAALWLEGERRARARFIAVHTSRRLIEFGPPIPASYVPRPGGAQGRNLPPGSPGGPLGIALANSRT